MAFRLGVHALGCVVKGAHRVGALERPVQKQVAIQDKRASDRVSLPSDEEDDATGTSIIARRAYVHIDGRQSAHGRTIEVITETTGPLTADAVVLLSESSDAIVRLRQLELDAQKQRDAARLKERALLAASFCGLLLFALAQQGVLKTDMAYDAIFWLFSLLAGVAGLAGTRVVGPPLVRRATARFQSMRPGDTPSK